MAFGHKRNANAVDRAVDDIERQIAALQQQMRALDGDGRVGRAVSRAESTKKFVKEMLSPPPKRTTTTYHARREVLDAAAQPMKELEAEPRSVAQQPATDLFIHA